MPRRRQMSEIAHLLEVLDSIGDVLGKKTTANIVYLALFSDIQSSSTLTRTICAWRNSGYRFICANAHRLNPSRTPQKSARVSANHNHER